ncbi:MAG: prolyl aminopeptidase [Hyphomicrobiaceae bacterium]
MDHQHSAAQRLTLYPPLPARKNGRIRVSDLHEIYFEECGNPDGIPVVVLHGGPGGGSNPMMRRFHDPNAYRIILFDQRGCGRSTPHAELRENTTWDLVADMERLRQRLGIERWQLFGGSWGSTLSLVYAITHPERVSSLVLRGIFMLQQDEISWFYKAGCNWLFPDAYEAFLSQIPAEERHDIVTAYYQRLTSSDPTTRLAAAKAWSVWEASTLSLKQSDGRIKALASDQYALAFARIECHYFVNRGFLDGDDWIMRNISTIHHLPCTIVHGRYDVVTPLRNAWRLSTAWPNARLRIVADAGHAMSEPGIAHELVSATRDMATRIS